LAYPVASESSRGKRGTAFGPASLIVTQIKIKLSDCLDYWAKAQTTRERRLGLIHPKHLQ
jgi:hypothetical protein